MPLLHRSPAFVLASVLVLASASFLRADNHPSFSVRAGVSLNGEWKVIIDPYENGYYDYRWQPRPFAEAQRSEGYFMDAKPRHPSERIEYNFDASPSLQVPGDWNTQMKELYFYEGSIWYRKKFNAERLKDGQRAFLHFGAANYRADVFLNGRKAGTHIGGFTPFSLEVTEWIQPGENSVVVRVDNKRSKDGVPTLNTDWWNYGGLTRDVKLVVVPATFITAHRLSLDSEETRTVSGSVQVRGATQGQPVELSLPELNQTVTATTDAGGRASFRFTADRLQLWSPEHPKLYQVRIRAGADEISDEVGFRTIRTKGRQVLLNGKPVFFRGICLHDEYAVEGGGRVTTPAQAERLLGWAKELNCNFVRLAHYPHNEHTVRAADRLGLLVWSEIPVYWTIDWENEETYRNAEAQLTDMIERDAARAAVIIWSLANETPVTPARTTFLTRLAVRARTLDSTRLISAALEKHAKPGEENVAVVQDPLAEVVDLVSFNQYVGWYDGTPEKCAQVRWEIPYDKPVFISEFGGDARQGLHGSKEERWTEEYQVELYRQTLAMIDRIEGVVGFSPWILVDFRSPRRMLPKVQDGFNRKGLISSEGVKKDAFAVLKEYYGRKSK